MKTRLIMIPLMLFSTMVMAQKEEVKKIKTTIEGFVKAGDENNHEEIGNYLDANYRVVMNRLFGSEAVGVVNKDEYIAKIESKEWGGDKREITYEEIIITGTVATAKVKLVGSKMTFISNFTLIQNAEGDWMLLSDTPVIEA